MSDNQNKTKKKAGGKMKQPPAAMKHNRTTQDELHTLSVVLRVFLILTNSLLLCQTRENDARRGKALLLFVWDDVWPLSLATSSAPHIKHPLGPNVDKDRKTTTVRPNVKPWRLLLGRFCSMFFKYFYNHASKTINPHSQDTWGQPRSPLM